jgi:uncharacterized membrane protein YkvA (DUF1232 family)
VHSLVIGLAVAVGVWLALVALLFALGRRRAARELLAFVPDCLVLFRRLLGDERVPRSAKVGLALAIAYLAMPFDVVPDFLPVVGQLDDAIVVAAVVAFVARRTGRDVIQDLWPGSAAGLRAVLVLVRS